MPLEKSVTRRGAMNEIGKAAIAVAFTALPGVWETVFGEELSDRIAREGIADKYGNNKEFFKEDAERIIKKLKEKYDINITTPKGKVVIEGEKNNYQLDEVGSSYVIYSALQSIEKLISRFRPGSLKGIVESIELIGGAMALGKALHMNTFGFANAKTKTLHLKVESVLYRGAVFPSLKIFTPHFFFHEVTHLLIPVKEIETYRKFLYEAYGSGGYEQFYDPEYLNKDETDVLRLRREGFATPYGKTSVLEDVADIVGKLLGRDEMLLEEAKDSPILAKKVDFLKRELISRLGLPATYWADLAAGKVNDSYWQ